MFTMTTKANSTNIIKPFNKLPTPNTATVLLIGAEGVGKHTLAKHMVIVNQDKFNILIRTATQLPLPSENVTTRPRIDFLCFMVDLTSLDSMKTVEEAMKFVDARYFLGRSCIVATRVKQPEKRSVHLATLSEFADHYGINILYGSTENDIENISLAKKILNLTEVAAGLKNNVSPLLLMSNHHLNVGL